MPVSVNATPPTTIGAVARWGATDGTLLEDTASVTIGDDATITIDGTQHPDAGTLIIEELGNLGLTTDSRAGIHTRISRVLGSLMVSRNLTLDEDTWVHQNILEPGSLMEVGFEGVTLHAVPAGATSFSGQHHELLQARSEGTETLYGGVPSSGKWIQAKVPLFMAYDQTEYDGDDAHSWGNNGQPFIYLLSNDLLSGTDPGGEWVRLEQCSNSVSGGQIHFLKSRGEPATKVKSDTDDVAGVLSFGQWDGGTYQMTARILTKCAATPQLGSAPQSLQFQTSTSNTGGLDTRMTIAPDGRVIAHNGLTVENGVTMSNLPSSDPHSPGVLWNSNGSLMISAG